MDGLFVVLFVLFLQSMASRVEPPADVVFNCHNMSNILEWSYRENVPGLRFRVAYSGYSSKSGELWVDPQDLQADISFLSDISDTYLVTVTAVIGTNESDADDIVFTYGPNNALSTHKCFLDFPPVTVTNLGDDSVLFSFQHPAIVYNISSTGSQNTNQKRKRSPDYEIDEQLPEFKYDVEFINETTKEARFSCVESVCEEEISMDLAQKKHCLKFSGSMLTVEVKPTECCIQPPKTQKDYMYIFVIVGLLLGVAVIALIFSMIYQKITRPSTPLPKPLTERLKQFTFGPAQESVSKAEVVPASPTPLLSSDEEKEEKDFTPGSTTDEIRLPIGVPADDDEGVCDDVKVESDEDTGYTKGKNFEEDETEDSYKASSGYEKRHVIIELAPDEQAEGYRG